MDECEAGACGRGLRRAIRLIVRFPIPESGGRKRRTTAKKQRGREGRREGATMTTMETTDTEGMGRGRGIPCAQQSSAWPDGAISPC